MLASFILMMALGAQNAPDVPPQPIKPKLICRQDEQELGSHIHTGRHCKTAEEWRIEDDRRARVSPSTRVTDMQSDPIPRPPRPQL